MLRFEDLMAARLLYRQMPERRDVLLAQLDALQAGRGQRSLLATLVDEGVIAMEEARRAFGQVEAYKRERSLGIYAHLLATEGVGAAQLQALRERIGPEGDLNALGEAVVRAAVLPLAKEQQLRFQARLVCDRDMANQVAQHLAAHPSPPAAASSPAASASPPLGASIRLKASELAAHAPPAQQDDVSALVRGTLSDADGELPGPRFPIPSWVDMSDPLTGKQLASYRILGRIGAGAMGTVYLADEQEEPERPVAVKVLRPGAPDDAVGRFKREILANSFFSHPGALDVYGAGETARGYHYLAMEFFDGEDLAEMLDEVGKLPPRTALELARQVFETLGAAHEAGLIHRDVKPANILVSHDYGRARLMDFGIALIRNLDEFDKQVFSTNEGGVTGTPEYMSPEQAAEDSLTGSSDLYSMGIVLYHMLSGRLPFDSETSGGYMNCHMLEEPLPLAKAEPALKLPRELTDLVDALLAKSPADRPADAAAVIAAIDALLPKVKERGTSRFLGFLGWKR